jgi:hypothetical protein
MKKHENKKHDLLQVTFKLSNLSTFQLLQIFIIRFRSKL